MARSTKSITFSVPPEMDTQIKELVQREGLTRSELLRKALRRYLDERSLHSLSLEIGDRAAEIGIATEDQVVELVHAIRRGQ